MHNSFILQQYVCYTTILNMFRAARCSSSGGQIVPPQPLVSSPSVNSRIGCRWRADCSPQGDKLYHYSLWYRHSSQTAVQYAGGERTVVLRRTNCITTASGIVTLHKQPYSMQVDSGLQSSGGQIVSLQPLVSSLFTNSRTVCRWTADCSPLSTCILYGSLQRVTIPEVVVIQFVLLRMSSVLLETC